MKRPAKCRDIFDAEAHFESRMGLQSIRSQGVVLDFTTRPLKKTPKKMEKGLTRVCHDRYYYESFIEINALHRAYISELKGQLGPDAFLSILWQAELTGAMITIAGKEGIVVEERKNSLVVIFSNDKVKIFPKAVWDFCFQFDGVTYFFYAKNLRHNRLMK